MPAHAPEGPDQQGEPEHAPHDTGAYGRDGQGIAEGSRPAGAPDGGTGADVVSPAHAVQTSEDTRPQDGRNEPIDPAGVVWSRVDERYITVRLIGGVGGWLLIAATIAVPLVLGWLGIWGTVPVWLQILAISVLVIWAAADFALIPRRTRAIGYAERQDDLLIRRGLLFQRVVSVPYGRLQYVDIQAGPLMRWFGLCTVELKTASAATDASIPGVVRAEGARLREELSARGQARLAGL